VTVLLAPDQQGLFKDVCTKIDRMADPDSLALLMGKVLHSLLRRTGDAEFLAAVQDAFIAGLEGRPWEGQRQLARQVAQVVIEIRPEIALAWQAQHLRPGEVPQRRASDATPSIFQTQPPAPAAALPQVEQVVANFITGIIQRRLDLFAVPAPHFPSIAYCHDQPFFLFAPAFAPVALAFITGELMELCHQSLQRHVYTPLTAKLDGSAEAIDAFLEEKRAEIWKILTERLGKLGGRQHSAEAKIANCQDGDGTGPVYKVVEVPVQRPRVLSVLGVSFTLGQKTAMRKVRVRDKSGEIDSAEMEALTLITRLRDMAAQQGLELPAACDFHFFATLLDFDGNRYAHALKEYFALAGHEKTSRAYLFERLAALDRAFTNTISDALVLTLFTQLSERGFGLQELYDVCIGTARASTAQASKRPFVQSEVARRPRELAFQLREVVRRRHDVETLRAAAEMLFTAWRTLGKSRFANERTAALTVLRAFPVVFAGDPDEATLCEISHVLYRTLSAEIPDYTACITAICSAYRAVVDRSARSS
jgi:hypothetical protein